MAGSPGSAQTSALPALSFAAAPCLSAVVGLSTVASRAGTQVVGTTTQGFPFSSVPPWPGTQAVGVLLGAGVTLGAGVSHGLPFSSVPPSPGTQGVGVTLGVGVSLGVGAGVMQPSEVSPGRHGLGSGVGVSLGVGVADGVGVGVGVTLGVGVADGVTLGVLLGVGVGVTDGVSDGVGVGFWAASQLMDTEALDSLSSESMMTVV